MEFSVLAFYQIVCDKCSDAVIHQVNHEVFKSIHNVLGGMKGVLNIVDMVKRSGIVCLSDQIIKLLWNVQGQYCESSA